MSGFVFQHTQKPSRIYTTKCSPILKGYNMGKGDFTCFQILKPTMNKWAQCPVPMVAQTQPYSMRILRALGDVLFRPSTHQNWSRDRKLTDLLVFALISRLTHWHARLAVTQVCIEKIFCKNIEIGFQSAIFHLCQRALVPLLRNDRGQNATASIEG